MGEHDEQFVFEMGYDKGFKDGIKGSIPKDQYEARLKADYVSKKKIAQATNKIIKCSLGEWYAGREDGKTEEIVLMDDVLHIMQGLLNEKEQINEN